jgi:hypothetical protein
LILPLRLRRRRPIHAVHALHRIEDGLRFERRWPVLAEPRWKVLDLDSSSHGFVLQLRDGRRLYLERLIYLGDDDMPIKAHDLRHMAAE